MFRCILKFLSNFHVLLSDSQIGLINKADSVGE